MGIIVIEVFELSENNVDKKAWEALNVHKKVLNKSIEQKLYCVRPGLINKETKLRGAFLT